MRKITLILLISLPLFMVGQSWEFNNDNGGWSGDFGTLTPGTSTSTFTITGVSGENPKLVNMTAGVMAPANEFAVITLKNNSNNGYLRFSYPKTNSGRIFKNQVISTNDSAFQTYVVDISNNNHFVGTLDDFQIIFKIDASTNADGSGGTIEVERIEFTSTRPILPQSTYEFNTNNDLEGWSGKSGLSLNVSNGNLVQDYSSVSSNGNAKMAQEAFFVDTSSAQYAHLVLQNGTVNDELRISYPDNAGGRIFRTIPTTANSTSFETVDIDLSSPAWTGNVSDIEIQLRESVSQNTLAGGTVIIDLIVFDNNATLSNEQAEFSTFSLFPNPAVDKLYFNSNIPVDQVSIYNITGSKVYHSTSSSNTIDITGLTTGIYLVKASASGNSITSKLIIK